ncbi:hypothetical protein [Roseibium sp.]|uniref:hypothetical protein n=1 Tax=Roseibium sp. TaxID=1936156 RepID=UPI003BACEAAB
MHPLLAQRRQEITRDRIALHDLEIEKNLNTLIALCQSKKTSNVSGLREVGEKLACYAILLKKLDPETVEGRQLRHDLKEIMEQLKSALEQKFLDQSKNSH